MNPAFYVFTRFVVGTILRLLYRIRPRGLERVPVGGGFILCANHIHALDPAVLAIVLRRPVHFMAKEELFRYPLLGNLLLKAGAFPVKRGRADRKALRHAMQVVEDGGVLGLFPEGTRSSSGELQEAKGGAAFLALRTGVPVLPAAIRGRYNLFGEVEVIVGEPFVVETDERGSGRIDAAGQRIMEGIRRLLEKR